MRKIMVVLMVMALLVGMMTICPMAATLTEDIHAELRPALSASAEVTGKIWAEAYVLDSVKGLTPMMEKTVLK